MRWLPFLLFCLVLIACNTEEPSDQGTPVAETVAAVTTVSEESAADSLTILYWQAPSNLNPHLADATKDWHAARIVYEPLASFNKEGDLIPFLAAEIPTVENGGLDPEGASVTWTLKQGVLWADGQPFTAADVVFTYNFIINPDSNSSSAGIYGSIIEAVEALDDHTVKITFQEANPVAWITPFIGLRGMIIPEHIFADYNGANATDAPANEFAIGTGPYQVVDFKPQETLFLGTELIQTLKIVFEPNEHFREENKPYFSQIILRGGSTVEEAARLVLEVGEADFAWNLQLDAVTLASFEAGGQGIVSPNFGTRVERLVLNRSDPNIIAGGERANKDIPNPFFNDITVREAISLAIDRNRIAALYGPTGQTTSNILVAPENFTSPNTSFVYDPDRARQLLADAGWVDTNGDGIVEKDGLPFRIVSQTSSLELRIASQNIIKENLRDIGIDVELKIIDSSNYGNRSVEDNVWHFYADMQEFFSGGSSPDPTAYMQRWTQVQIPQAANDWNAGWNVERWQSDEYDMLIQQVLTEPDPVERERLFIEMNDLLVHDIVTIPLVHIAQAAGVSNTLAGVDLTPWDADTWNIKDWERITQ